jgi:hypothetical protein
MGNPDQNDLDLDNLADAISKAKEQEEEAPQKLLAAMDENEDK